MQQLTAENLDNMSILVIDDEPDSREMLAVLINEKGAKVDSAGSVDEALSKINDKEYDLVISDIGMPEKDGYELARSIRTHKNQSIRLKPIIALSAYAREMIATYLALPVFLRTYLSH